MNSFNSVYFLKNLSIQYKFIIAFSILFLLFTANYFAIRYCRSLAREDALIVDVSGRNRMLSQKIALLAEMIIDGKEDVRDELLSCIELHNTSLNALKFGGIAPGLDGDKVLPASSIAVMPTLMEVESFWEKYKQNALIIAEEEIYTDKIITNTTIDTSGEKHIETTNIQELNPAMNKAITYLEKNHQQMLVKNNNLVKSYVLQNQYKQARLDYFSFGFYILTIIMLITLISFISKFIVKPLKKITIILKQLSEGELMEIDKDDRTDEIGQVKNSIYLLNKMISQATLFSKKIGEGEFGEEYVLAGKNDLLGKSIIEMRDKLKSIADESSIRRWKNNGFTQFNNLLRFNDEEIDEVLQRILSEIVKYVSANQAAFFIVQEDGNEHILNLTATYAMGRNKYITKKIHKGEGLIGQCWLEKETIYLKELPEGHFEITSGLGFSEPKTLLILPLNHNEEVCGILEIAFLEDMPIHIKEFLEELTTDIAATILRIKINNRTKKLLQQAQSQAEELRAQEEEMRQNQEELNATQEEMIRQKTEMEKELISLREQLEKMS